MKFYHRDDDIPNVVDDSIFPIMSMEEQLPMVDIQYEISTLYHPCPEVEKKIISHFSFHLALCGECISSDLLYVDGSTIRHRVPVVLLTTEIDPEIYILLSYACRSPG
jgi:hypothetical protein